MTPPRTSVGTVLARSATVLAFTVAAAWVAPATAADLKVMKTGLGAGTITSTPAAINCGSTCTSTYTSPDSVTLNPVAGAGASFVRWEGDCTGSGACVVTMSADRSVRAVFDLATPVPPLTTFTPAAIQGYLSTNASVNTAARFIAALPVEFRRNWILMTRSESLQTGTAEFPRILLPSADAQFVFSAGLATHGSYPGSHPDAIEFMQWDPAEKNFRFHEIVLAPIAAMGSIPARSRGVSVDDAKCSRCHSTRNVLNTTASPGTNGVPPGSVKVKSKPNWDAYDSWGGMMPFNRDRIYQGSVEAAAFRKIFNPWTWRGNDAVRALVEQLELQPPGVPAAHVITRTAGGANDGHVNFGFDASPPVLVEPSPSGSSTSPVTYSFDRQAGAPPGTTVQRGGSFITLHHSNIPTSDEGRGVRLFDALGGLAGTLNQQRVADELISHRFATGSRPIDVRPVALAITKSCLAIDAAGNRVVNNTGVGATAALTIDQAFFTGRSGMTVNDVLTDTRLRSQSQPLRKADIEKLNVDRTGDPYLFAATNGLAVQYGGATAAGTSTAIDRLRQEVFRREQAGFAVDATVMGGVFVDREQYSYNTNRVALYRYFLEPLGVSVDKWSMGVRGRSRTYTFADVFSTYANVLQPQIEASLTSDPIGGLAAPFDCNGLIGAINTTLGALPPVNEVPTFTDVQRIFNKSCIECHGGLGYPPYGAGGFDLSEDDNLSMGSRLARSYANAVGVTTTDPATSYLFQRITAASENCPGGLMPCGGPALSKTDVETIRRWIVGPPSRPSTVGDPHVRTVDGTNYDFQSAGEFVLLRDEFFEVQARQSAVSTDAPLPPNAHTGLASCVSINTAVAVRVGNQRITYQPAAGDAAARLLQLRVDGKPASLEKGELRLASGARIVRVGDPGGIQIDAPGGTSVVVTPAFWNHYAVWYMNIDVRSARATQGVIGAIAPGNWLPALPDGRQLGARPGDLHQRYVDLYQRFSDAWRVTDASSLFDYAPGTTTRNFTLAGWPAENPQSCLVPILEGPATPPPARLPLETARQACRALVADDRRANCEVDVAATGEPGFAATYLRSEKIARNAPPSAPQLVSPENNVFDLARPVRFSWRPAVDPDGDAVTYRHCVWLAGDRASFAHCSVDPIAPAQASGGGNFLVVLFVVGVLVVLLVFGLRRRDLLGLVLVVLVLALLLAFQLGKRGRNVDADYAGLESGKAYLWKVIAEDGRGASTESETRRFTVR